MVKDMGRFLVVTDMGAVERLDHFTIDAARYYAEVFP
jgi:hypothetical protein